jgi:hypothetical protein
MRIEQAVIRTEIPCTKKFFIFRLLLQQCQVYGLPLFLIFIDFIVVFNTVEQVALWCILEEDGMPLYSVDLLKVYYEGTQMRARAYGEEPENFDVHSGLKQGDVLSSIVLIM